MQLVNIKLNKLIYPLALQLPSDLSLSVNFLRKRLLLGRESESESESENESESEWEKERASEREKEKERESSKVIINIT